MEGLSTIKTVVKYLQDQEKSGTLKYAKKTLKRLVEVAVICQQTAEAADTLARSSKNIPNTVQVSVTALCEQLETTQSIVETTVDYNPVRWVVMGNSIRQTLIDVGTELRFCGMQCSTVLNEWKAAVNQSVEVPAYDEEKGNPYEIKEDDLAPPVSQIDESIRGGASILQDITAAINVSHSIADLLKSTREFTTVSEEFIKKQGGFGKIIDTMVMYADNMKISIASASSSRCGTSIHAICSILSPSENVKVKPSVLFGKIGEVQALLEQVKSSKALQGKRQESLDMDVKEFEFHFGKFKNSYKSVRALELPLTRKVEIMSHDVSSFAIYTKKDTIRDILVALTKKFDKFKASYTVKGEAKKLELEVETAQTKIAVEYQFLLSKFKDTSASSPDLKQEFEDIQTAIRRMRNHMDTIMSTGSKLQENVDPSIVPLEFE